MRIRFIVIMQAMLFFVLACGCSVLFKGDGQAPDTQEPSASLLSAIDFGSLEWVKEEIQNGADLNTVVAGNLLSHNVVPLQYAYKNCSNPEVPDYLIRAGADLSFEDSQGNSLLFSAALRSDGVEWCQLLLEHGIDIDHTNKKGETALDVAAKEGYYSTSEFLLDNGAKVSQHTLELALQGVSGQGYEHLDLVQLILNRCSSSDVNNVLPISIVKAIEGNSKYLLDLGADDITALNSEYQKCLVIIWPLLEAKKHSPTAWILGCWI